MSTYPLGRRFDLLVRAQDPAERSPSPHVERLAPVDLSLSSVRCGAETNIHTNSWIEDRRVQARCHCPLDENP